MRSARDTRQVHGQVSPATVTAVDFGIYRSTTEGWRSYVDCFLGSRSAANAKFQTDEQAPLPGVFTQLLHRVRSGLEANADFVFNCQMGRGRTTTGMITACLIATTDGWSGQEGQTGPPVEDVQEEFYDSLDGPSEEEAYMQGKCLPRLPLRYDWTNRFSCAQANTSSSSNSWGCYPTEKLRRSWPTGQSI